MSADEPPAMKLIGCVTAVFPPSADYFPGSWKVSLYASDAPMSAAFWVVAEGKSTNWIATDYLNDKFPPKNPMDMWDDFEAWVEDGGILFSDS